MRSRSHSISIATICMTIAITTSLMAADHLQERTHHRSERMAAWHSTVVAVDEKVPNTALMTYITDRPTHTERYMFTKVIPFLKVDGHLLGPAKSKFVEVDDSPGYVKASYLLGDVKVEFEVIPLKSSRCCSCRGYGCE